MPGQELLALLIFIRNQDYYAFKAANFRSTGKNGGQRNVNRKLGSAVVSWVRW